MRSNHGSAPYCIYGPPGTGKTMTVAESIVQLLRHDTSRKILVCAPNDVACDVITKRLLPVKTKETKVLRINWWSRNPSSLPPVLLPYSPMDDKGFFVFPSTEEIKEANVIICQCFVAVCLEPTSPLQLFLKCSSKRIRPGRIWQPCSRPYLWWIYGMWSHRWCD